MKRIFSFFSILIITSLACGLPTAQTPEPSNVQPETESPDTITLDTASCSDPMCLTTSLSLTRLQNRGVDENVVKLFSVAVDEEHNLVYVAGIMTPNVAILDGSTEKWIGIVETGVTERGIKYIYFDSAAQYLYVFETESSTLRRINVATGEMATPAHLNGGFASVAFVDETHTRFYLPIKKGLTAFDGNTLQELFVAQGLGENSGAMVYDQATDSIYMLASQGKSARSILVINAASGQVTGEIQYNTQANGRAPVLL